MQFYCLGVCVCVYAVWCAECIFNDGCALEPLDYFITWRVYLYLDAGDAIIQRAFCALESHFVSAKPLAMIKSTMRLRLHR